MTLAEYELLGRAGSVPRRSPRGGHPTRAQRSGRIVVPNHVRGETWTFLRRRGGHRVATDFLDRIDADPRIEIDVVTPEVEADAWRWLRRHDERAYSFVDAVSFAVMRRRRIREALAFDGDFAAAGFIELRA